MPRHISRELSHGVAPNPDQARPLTGRRILVTRAREQVRGLSELIRREGGEPVELPTIRIHPPDDWSDVDAAMDALSTYDWVVFTSVNGVKLWMERMRERGVDVGAFGDARIAAIGPATDRELQEYALRADLVPREFIAESVLEALLRSGVEGKRFLLPRAAEARELLARGLEAAGAAEVTELPLYDTLPGSADAAPVLAQLHGGRIDAATFTSSSTVRNFARLAGGAEQASAALARTTVVCIGPVTARTARELGIRVDAEAAEHTMPGLVEALEVALGRGTARN
jgi:uroporphyrinogen III methyltransferase/synthase